MNQFLAIVGYLDEGIFRWLQIIK